MTAASTDTRIECVAVLSLDPDGPACQPGSEQWAAEVVPLALDAAVRTAATRDRRPVGDVVFDRLEYAPVVANGFTSDFSAWQAWFTVETKPI